MLPPWFVRGNSSDLCFCPAAAVIERGLQTFDEFAL